MTPGPRARIMLVEDERIVALNLRQRLELLGYEVPAVAASGREAIAAASVHVPDLVLMDIRIEGDIDGIETARRLNEARATPVVYLTAHSEDSTLARARETSPYGYLLKPFSEREMHAAIQMALARSEIDRQLERRVAERTAELQRANEDLADYDYAVSHELQAPVRHILGFLERAGEAAGVGISEELQAAHHGIRRSAERIQRLIADQLRFSMAKRAAIKRRDVDLSRLAEGILERLREAEPGREVKTRIEPGIHAHADPTAASIVLENLMGNAWKYTANTVAAQVEVYRQGAETCVRDNGPGFTPREGSFRAFERFHADSVFQGTGLGLAIASRLVERHGGRLRVESAPGQGATFCFGFEPLPARTGGGEGSA